MIVKWNGDGLLVAPLVEQNTDASKTGVPFQVGGEKIITIIPGFNEVPDEVWANIEPHIQDKMKSGQIEEFSKQEKGDDGIVIRHGIPLRRFLPERAREVVRNCFSLDSLQKWLEGYEEVEQETRDEIRNEIKDQIEKIKAGGR